MPLHYLNIIKKKLQDAVRQPRKAAGTYCVPSLWLGERRAGPRRGSVEVAPHEFFLNGLTSIEEEAPAILPPGEGGEWTRGSVIYNMFVRSTCAFDHDQNGRLDHPVNSGGWRESGSFLKAIMLLPYVKSLGANVVHLLPVTSIGSDGNKGRLGSPYAIRNPYELDRNLSEPNLGLGADDEFRAFVEAAHHMGIRVVMEFVFRTAAKDGDWVKEHPEWFYWIRESVKDRLPGVDDESAYGPPIFTKEELQTILKAVEEGRYDGLTPPHREYIDLFTPPPPSDSIALRNGRYIGMLREHERVRIPGAFADWPPEDSQPPWGDVTFLKMYDHPDFNYIAYNTIRMYDSMLARDEYINRALWEKVAEIIPYYQKNFQIDGVMIDMGHALPIDLKKEMVRRARSIDPGFAFWDENFAVEEQSVREGYNAVIGYQWSDQHNPKKFGEMLRRFGSDGYPLPFFATPESHNTPRAATREGGIIYSRYAWAISNFIPAIPFIHSGFELGERWPVNTGLDFTPEDLAEYPSEELPLFSEFAYDWTNKEEITKWIRTISGIRRKYKNLIVDTSLGSFICHDTDNSNVLGFLRSSSKVLYQLLVVANSHMSSNQPFAVTLPEGRRKPQDLITGELLHVEKGVCSGSLKPGEVIVAEL